MAERPARSQPRRVDEAGAERWDEVLMAISRLINAPKPCKAHFASIYSQIIVIHIIKSLPRRQVTRLTPDACIFDRFRNHAVLMNQLRRQR